MGIEIINQACQLKDGAQTFTFSGNIDAFVYGLTGIDVWYADDKDHHLQTFSVSLSPNQPSSNTIHLTPSVQFTDASGKQASSNSYISMTVVAWIGDDADRNVSMNNADDLGTVNFNTGTTPSFSQALMSGFDLSYGDSDHHVQSITTTTGVQSSGSTATLAATASMSDNDGNQASIATVDAAYISALKSDPGFGFSIVKIDAYGMDQSTEFLFDQDIDQAGIFMFGYDLSYGDGKDHHIYTIGLGVWSPDAITIDGNKATANVGLLFQDGYPDGHEAATHTLNLVAIGRYA